MGYNADGHGHRVNYYSNPDVILPDTGTPTGVAGTSNNAAVLTRNRFMMAALGDESASCDSSGGGGEAEGEIQSPNYPNVYPHNLDEVSRAPTNIDYYLTYIVRPGTLRLPQDRRSCSPSIVLI